MFFFLEPGNPNKSPQRKPKPTPSFTLSKKKMARPKQSLRKKTFPPKQTFPSLKQPQLTRKEKKAIKEDEEAKKAEAEEEAKYVEEVLNDFLDAEEGDDELIEAIFEKYNQIRELEEEYL
jgi:hypothetical protein